MTHCYTKEFCVFNLQLFSCGLAQNGEKDDDYLWGFVESEVKQEVARASRLVSCMQCTLVITVLTSIAMNVVHKWLFDVLGEFKKAVYHFLLCQNSAP